MLLIFLLTVCKEKTSLFLRKGSYNYLPTEIITFNFPSHDSDFSAMLIQVSVLHLRKEEEKTRQLVSTNVTFVFPALLNTEIIWISIPRDCFKKKEVTKHKNTHNTENKMGDTNRSDSSKTQYSFFVPPYTLLSTLGKSGIFQRQRKWRD